MKPAKLDYLRALDPFPAAVTPYLHASISPARPQQAVGFYEGKALEALTK